MTPKDCKYFNECSANLCPLDPELKLRIWCPEENGPDEICKNREFAGLQFIRTQRKIARATRNRTEERDDYFTFEMLNRDIVVRSGVQGIPDPPDTVKDPEKWYSEKERKWIEGHHEISRTRSDILRQRGKRLAESRKLIQKVASDNANSEITDSKGVITRLDPTSPLKSIENGGSER